MSWGQWPRALSVSVPLVKPRHGSSTLAAASTSQALFWMANERSARRCILRAAPSAKMRTAVRGKELPLAEQPTFPLADSFEGAVGVVVLAGGDEGGAVSDTVPELEPPDPVLPPDVAPNPAPDVLPVRGAVLGGGGARVQLKLLSFPVVTVDASKSTTSKSAAVMPSKSPSASTPGHFVSFG